MPKTKTTKKSRKKKSTQKSRKGKQSKSQQQQKELDLNMGFDTRLSGLLYKFRKVEAILEFAPFWRDSLVWFVISLDIFAHIVLYIFVRDNLPKLPPQIPFLYFFAQGDKQLVTPDFLWYVIGVSVIFSFVNLLVAGRIFDSHKHEAKLLLYTDLIKSALLVFLIFKTIINLI